MFDLSGKRAVVTGASSGLGQAIAAALAEAGADVASLYLTDPQGAASTARAIESVGCRSMLIEGDVGDPAQVDHFANQVRDAWGSIDIWVNNAGRLLVRSFTNMIPDEWHDLMRSNLHGYYYGCRAAVPDMIKRGWGRIINISSATDIQPISDMTAYITAKGGIVAFTKALALELGHRGVTVNAVAPGAMDTPLTAHTYTPRVRAAYQDKIAVGRVGKPSDVIGAIVFLASEEAAYVTGHELLVDGGLVLNGNTDFAESPAGTATND